MKKIALTALAVALPSLIACDPAAPESPEPREEIEAPPPCTYPASTGLNAVGSIMPHVSWDPAIQAGEATSFDLKDAYCDAADDGLESIVFVLTTQWCPNCPSYIDHVNQQAPQMLANNTKIVWVSLQDQNFNPTDSQSSDNYITPKIGQDLGLRVGSSDASEPVIYNSPIWSGVPNAFVVRTSDMKVVASQETSQFLLDFVSITENIDATDPTTPVFESSCGESDDESFEPNNTPNEAGTLAIGTIEGGICDENPDFYRVDVAGDWRIDLGFTNAVGDLDIYVIDEVDGTALTGSESVDDNEQLDHSGPALIQVVGYQNASAPYTLTLSER